MFHSDRPIDAAENDLLHRSGFAKLLARSLIDPNSPDTFTIGLFGKWGSGKTSIVNMTLNYIEESSKTMSPEDAPIVVHFEPWNFSNTDQLLTQFFIHLSNEFRSKDDEKSIKIGEALEKYADAFELAKAIPVVGGLVAYLGKKLAISLGKKLKNGYDEKDILKQKELVIELLQKQTNRLLIIIDDIDRLTNEQIRLVFQLITSVANFPNTTYLVVFDKEIVVNALKTVQGCNGEDYLKKIIQVPIQIPDMQGYELRTVFITQLNKLISDNEDVMVSPEYWQNLFDPCIDPFIKNLRDVNRLCNAVQFKLAAIAAEVNFTDMVAISAIELFRPPIYEWIKSNKDLLTGQIISIHPEENNKDELYERYKQSIRLSLKHYKFDTSDEDLEIILIFLSYLFPYFGNKIGKTYNSLDADVFRKNNQITHPEKFDRYFHLNPDNVSIKKSEILNVIYEATCEDVKASLLKQGQDGNIYSFLKEINLMIPEISSARSKVIAKALLEISSSFDGMSNSDSLLLPASKYAENMILDLIDKQEPSERFTFLSDEISNGDLDTVQSSADILSMIELGYGRLIAKGVEQGYKKVITLEELSNLEQVFCQKIKDLFAIRNLFDFKEWRNIYYLLKHLAPEYLNSYISAELQNDEKILRFLELSTRIWSGSFEKYYEVKDDYKEYLTEKRILQVIYNQKESGDLYSLPIKVQNICVTFYLTSCGKFTRLNQVSQTDIDELLSEWRKEYEKRDS